MGHETSDYAGAASNYARHEEVDFWLQNKFQAQPGLSWMGDNFVNPGWFCNGCSFRYFAGSRNCARINTQQKCFTLDNCVADNTDFGNCTDGYSCFGSRRCNGTFSQSNYFCLPLFFPNCNRYGQGPAFT